MPRSISAQADSLQLVVIGVPWVLPSTAAAPGSHRNTAGMSGSGESECGRTGSLVLVLVLILRTSNK